MAEEQTQTPAAAPAVEEGTKVFVGNLSYNTTVESLKAILKPEPTKIDLVLRPQKKSSEKPARSAGYAFATYANKSDAEEVVKLSGTTLEDRAMLIELANPPKPKVAPTPTAEKAAAAEGSEEKPKKKKSNKKKRANGRPARPEDAVDGAEEDVVEEAVAPVTNGTGEVKSVKAPRKRKTPAQRRAAAAAAAVEAGIAVVAPGEAGVVEVPKVEDGASAAASNPKPKKAKKAPKPKVAPVEGRIDDEQPDVATTSTPKAPRAPREKKERVEGPPSDTQLFIANLAFSVTDESLKEFFTEAGVSVESARIVKRKFGIKRSKGFGFVNTTSAEEQKKGLALEGKEIDGRAITVKIANTLAEAQEDSQNDKIDEDAVEAITSGIQATSI